MQSDEQGLRSLPSDLPWKTAAYLLLDGVSVEALPQRLYEWSEAPDFEQLYRETQWAELSDISPCLIRLSGPDDPVLAQFQSNAAQEWGYLLFSQANWPDLLAHLRWLVSVRHPLGETMLLRLADPAVAHVLFEHAARDQDATLFGPFERIVAADAVQVRWHQHQRPGQSLATVGDKSYLLSDEQLSLLGEVSFRSTVIQLDGHMREFFPTYRPELAEYERWQHLHTLASTAYEQGFNSERDITLYANIFGFLGERALDQPDIAELLTQVSAQTPSQRVERAAELAQARAESMDRSST